MSFDREDTMRKCVLVGAFLLVLATTACNKSSPTAPSAPAVPACERNHTGTITFTNHSGNGLTYTWRIDGVTIGVTAPGESTSPQTISAGVAHTWSVCISNTTVCVTLPLNVAQCSTDTRSESYSTEPKVQ
jgi:hypothetical protein